MEHGELDRKDKSEEYTWRDQGVRDQYLGCGQFVGELLDFLLLLNQQLLDRS